MAQTGLKTDLFIQASNKRFKYFNNNFPADKRKADLTNKAESIMDLLVDTKIIEDDNWFIINNINLKFGGVDTKNPRAEIEIS